MESIMVDDLLAQEREGLQIAKFFLDYCFRASDMLSMICPTVIVEKLREYALWICDECGGAMCDDNCPVSKYIDDMSKWLKGERTVFATDKTKQRNCDIGTPAEQARRFQKFCHLVRTHSCDCSNDCPFIDEPDIIHCQFAWAQMPYESADKQNDKNIENEQEQL